MVQHCLHRTRRRSDVCVSPAQMPQPQLADIQPRKPSHLLLALSAKDLTCTAASAAACVPAVWPTTHLVDRLGRAQLLAPGSRQLSLVGQLGGGRGGAAPHAALAPALAGRPCWQAHGDACVRVRTAWQHAVQHQACSSTVQSQCGKWQQVSARLQATADPAASPAALLLPASSADQYMQVQFEQSKSLPSPGASGSTVRGTGAWQATAVRSTA